MTGVLLAVLVAQSPATIAATDVARVRKALEQPAPIAEALKKGERPVYRVVVYAPRPERPMWEERSSVPGYVRPSMPQAHFDYLSMTTPEQFRASTLYPGMSLGPLLHWLGGNKTPEQVRRDKEAKARRDVQRDFEAFLQDRSIR